MEPEGLLPHSQEPATCPHPEPDESSPCLPIPLLQGPFLGAFAKLLKAAIIFVISHRPSLRMVQLAPNKKMFIKFVF
jgi:hypothetical protein